MYSWGKTYVLLSKTIKINAAIFAISTASTEREREKSLAKVLIMTNYGTSCFVQIVDDDAAPLANRKDKMQKQKSTSRNEKEVIYAATSRLLTNHLSNIIMIKSKLGIPLHLHR